MDRPSKISESNPDALKLLQAQRFPALHARVNYLFGYGRSDAGSQSSVVSSERLHDLARGDVCLKYLFDGSGPRDDAGC
jgi:hypothetical protein